MRRLDMSYSFRGNSGLASFLFIAADVMSAHGETVWSYLTLIRNPRSETTGLGAKSRQS